MTHYDYDLFVIGAGSGGVRAARVAAGLGARVAIAEERLLGGTCVNVGCVPKKLLVHAAHYREDFEDALRFGWDVDVRDFHWSRLIANKNATIERLHGIYERLLTQAGVTLIMGRATLVDPHTVAVGEERHRAKHILIATGGWPVIPEFPGKEHVVTSNEAFFLEDLPKRVAVVGGGYIAVEFAGIFNGLGCTTSLLYRGELFLRGFDDDARAFLTGEMRKKGVDLRFNTQVAGIKKTPDGLRVMLRDGQVLETDLVMAATGRVPNVSGLGLDRLGVKLNENGAIVVDGHFQSSIPSIHAIGDVIDRVQLTPVALAEGMALAQHLFGGASCPLDYQNIPTCVFSQPNLACVGLTESAARARFDEIDIYQHSFTQLKHTLSGRPERTLVKLVVERRSEQVLGAHLVGPEAGEVIQGIAIALKAGATKAVFDATLGIHPSVAEEFVTLRQPVGG
jgi:glutathione reductase (NADPH)